MRALIDADLPRSTKRLFEHKGHDALDIRDTPLRQAEDPAIARFAQDQKRAIITGDFGFADVRNYPPCDYQGIVVIEVPRNATARCILSIVEAFLEQEQLVAQLVGKLAIVEAGRVRIRT